MNNIIAATLVCLSVLACGGRSESSSHMSDNDHMMEEDGGTRPVEIIITEEKDAGTEPVVTGDLAPEQDAGHQEGIEPVPEQDAGEEASSEDVGDGGIEPSEPEPGEPESDAGNNEPQEMDEDSEGDAGSACVLLVAQPESPVSRNAVQGSEKVETLALMLTASGCDVSLNELPLFAFGDRDSNFAETETGFGDTPANSLASALTLYQGEDVIAGPEVLDADSRVSFNDLDFTIEDGETLTLTVTSALLNTMSDEWKFLALALETTTVQAEDEDGNAVEVRGESINLHENPDPFIQIMNDGVLSIYSMGNPESDIVIAGERRMVARYRFHALYEAWEVGRLTVCNDMTGAFDAPEPTTALSAVSIEYLDVNGVVKTAYGMFSGGCATFSDLGFYTPEEEDAYLQIYATVNTKASVGEALSGMEFRLGLRGAENTAATFEAVGKRSLAVLTEPAVNEGDSASPSFVVRTTKPSFVRAVGSSTLINGQNTLYGLTVTADSAGSVGFARLAFDFSALGLGDNADNLNALRFYRGASLIPSADVNIWCAGVSGETRVEVQISAQGLDACDGTIGDGLSSLTHRIIVSFNQEEMVQANASTTYYLKGYVAGVGEGDYAAIRLSIEDEEMGVDRLFEDTNPNTGRIFSLDNTGDGWFVLDGGDLSRTYVPGGGIMWSDRSADGHAYPTVSDGIVVSSSGSYDWTNGYLLGAAYLEPNILTY